MNKVRQFVESKLRESVKFTPMTGVDFSAFGGSSDRALICYDLTTKVRGSGVTAIFDPEVKAIQLVLNTMESETIEITPVNDENSANLVLQWVSKVKEASNANNYLDQLKVAVANGKRIERLI